MNRKRKPRSSQNEKDVDGKAQKKEVESHAAEKPPAQYLHYQEAFQLLSERVKATEAEMVGWVMLGSENGGLDGYRNPNSGTLLGAPFSLFSYDGEYLSLMMKCWFLINDIRNFLPEKVRFITGKDLIKRLGKRPGMKPIAFIRTKVAEGELYDLHPGGRTQWHSGPYLPSKNSALFMMSQVEKIEAECFSPPGPIYEPEVKSKGGVCAKDIREFFAFWDEKRWKAVMSRPPTWLDARIKPVVHRKGALWNPAELGNCLLAYRLKYSNDTSSKGLYARAIPSKTQLARIIEENFPEWQSDWQPDLD